MLILATALSVLATGCGQNELGRYTGYQPNMWVVNDPKRIRNPIVKSENYWIQKEVTPEEQFPGPTPDDLKPPEDDYILGPGDLVQITVFELMQPGLPYRLDQRISQSGQVTFPYIGAVKCSGLTPRGLEEKISDLLEPDYLVDPQVSIFVAEFRNLQVSVLNGVYRAGIYPMNKQDMTLLELVAFAGGVLQLVEDYGYVIREYAPEEADLLTIGAGGTADEKGAAPAEKGAAPAAPATPAESEAGTKVEPEKGAGTAPAATPDAPAPKKADEAAGKEAQKLLQQMAEGEMPSVEKIEAAEAAAPAAKPQPAAAKSADAADKPADAAAKPADAAAKEPDPKLAAMAMAQDEEELGHWVWSEGKWVEVKPKPGAAAKPAVQKPPAEAPGAPAIEPVKVAEGPTQETVVADDARLALANKLRRLGVVQGSGQLKRIIRFDVRALQAGDPTQNVVLRDGDIVTIPSPPVGDFYMAGEVARPGVYSLTGRKITLYQAVAAAGGLTAVAVPWRTELVRRISETEEEIIYVDLGKISRGEAPDLYLQPEDQVRVGTDQGALYNAVLRNAFRATYGLGAVYDMNFADFYPWSATVNPLF
ncbi:MAG: polysaccharide biosynthesis/export family protein [Planctomycetes bacterium]|nr:polysaccharide biosynthesis/export family protein [Planctomycetota bacterium]